jgi:trehalose 6-phosphate phosphatase
LAPIQTPTPFSDSSTSQDFFERLHVAPTSALLLDYDGTIAPFRAERNDAYPYPQVVPILDRIRKTSNTRIVIITGRPGADLKPLLQPLDHVEVWGAHGLEHLLPDGTYEQIPTTLDAHGLLSRAKDWLIQSELAPLAEFKPGGIAMHWRGLPEAEAKRVEAQVRRGWTELAQSGELKLLSFESGVELRVTRPDKGDAVRAIIEESASQTAIAYLGDDLTDEDSFQALNGRGLTVLVRPVRRESAAQIWLKPPDELIVFLERWLDAASKSTFIDETAAG